MKTESKNKRKIYNTTIILIFIWFTVQVAYIALTVKFNIASDEGFHWDLINVYRDRRSLLPFIKEQNDFFWLRDITRNPSYLYHYFFGLLFKIKPLKNIQLPALRIFNILFNILNLYLILKLVDEFTKSRWVKFLTLFMMANTLMYVFISMGINYDNLINPLSTLSILLTIKYLKDHKVKYLYYLCFTALIGMLVKYAFGPVIFIEALIILSETIKIFSRNSTRLIEGGKEQLAIWKNELSLYSKPIVIASSILFIILTVLFIERYGINLFQFKTVGEPNCALIHSHEDCLQSGVYKRNYNLLVRVKQESWRADFTLIEFLGNWTSLMLSRTFGMMVHKWMDPNPFTITGFIIISVLSFIYFIRYFDLHKKRYIRAVFIIALFYTLFLMLYVNYLEQKRYGYLGLAVQGRYIFPILGVWYFLLNRNIIRGLNKLKEKIRFNVNFFKYMYALFILIIFLDGGIFWYLKKAGKDWYENNRKPAVIRKYFKNKTIKAQTP